MKKITTITAIVALAITIVSCSKSSSGLTNQSFSSSQTVLAGPAPVEKNIVSSWIFPNADKPFIPLQKEIDFLQLYLSLENLRIPDLQFSIDVDKAVDKTTY